MKKETRKRIRGYFAGCLLAAGLLAQGVYAEGENRENPAEAEAVQETGTEAGPAAEAAADAAEKELDIETLDRMKQEEAKAAAGEGGAEPAPEEAAEGSPEETGMLKKPSGNGQTSAFSANTVEESGEALNEGMPDLKKVVENTLASWQGDWSVYVEDLTNGTFFQINDHSVRAASLIKLFVMGTVFDQIQKGNLQEDGSIDQLLFDMITVSDNESTNELVRRVSPDGSFDSGKEVVNAFIQEQGYTMTILGRQLGYYESFVQDNLTSARDCGVFLARVYQGTCVSPEASEKMLSLLRQQTRTHKIPAGVPSEVVTANKTGELDDTENDAAVLVLPDGHAYVLTVTSTALNSVGAAQSEIVSLSQIVYQYMAG